MTNRLTKSLPSGLPAKIAGSAHPVVFGGSEALLTIKAFENMTMTFLGGIQQQPAGAYTVGSRPADVLLEMVEAIQVELTEIRITLEHLASDVSAKAQVIPIVSLAPAPFTVMRDIPILVEPRRCEDADVDQVEYTARFVEANVGSSGDTVEEAISNVKDRLVSKYDFLGKTDSQKLSASVKRELAVLKSVIKRVQ